MRTGPLGSAVTCAGRLKPLKASQAVFSGTAGVAAKATVPVNAAIKAVKVLICGVKVLCMVCLLLVVEMNEAFDKD
jgi:hypothetical protein